MLQLSAGPHGPTEAQLDRLDMRGEGWKHVRAEEAGALRSLTIKAIEASPSR